MFDYFTRYKREHLNSLRLVLMGKEAIPIPENPDIVSLGFVDEATKFSVMSHALALLLFSPYESLSLVVLESMAVGRPVIVNEECEVLKGHVQRSDAGLTFSDYGSFAEAIEKMRTQKKTYARMCENGKRYISENYTWPKITELYKNLILSVNA